jgi:hypothetical protein
VKAAAACGSSESLPKPSLAGHIPCTLLTKVPSPNQPLLHYCSFLSPAPCRNADTLKRLQETEKAVREAAQAAYIDLDISSQEKEKGNAAFKEQR